MAQYKFNSIDRLEFSHRVFDNPFAMKTTHTHSFYEIYYLIKGEVTLQIASNYYVLHPGDIAIIAPNDAHKTSYSDGLEHERVCLEFSPHLLIPLYNQWGEHWISERLLSNVHTLPVENRSIIEFTLDCIQNELDSRDIFNKSLMNIYFQQLIIYIMRITAILPSVAHSQTPYNKNIELALDYINSNFSKRITLTEVAKYLHLNSAYFSKQFKTFNKIGFSEYLSNVRICHSEKLLLETNKTITEIAFESGFDNSNYYGDVFRKKNHCSPSDFRRLKGQI